MSKLNPVVTSSNGSHKNFMDGNSWDISNPFLKLRMVAASSFFGEPKYYDEKGEVVSSFTYTDGNNEIYTYIEQFLGGAIIRPDSAKDKTWQNNIEEIIDECLDKDVEKTLQIAVELRNVDMIRTTPQVILVRAAMHKNCKGTGLIRKYINQICTRGDEPAAGLSYLFVTYGKETAIPNSLKKGWKAVLESFNDYVISKYRMENNFVKTRDVVNLVHAYSESINKLMNGKAKQKTTWNNIVSNANKEEKTQKEIWTDALNGMPHMALLRNLRNLYNADVDFELYSEKLLNGVEGGKQLPFRYYSAYKAVSNCNSPRMNDLLAQCMEKAFANCPKLSGTVACLSDNSGSAWGTLTSELGSMHIAEIGNLMSVATAKMGDEGYAFAFGDELKRMNVQKTDSTISQVEKLTKLGKTVGGGTENGIWLFFDEAIKNKVHYDHIFVYSDMQCGHGGLYGLGSRPCKYKDYIFMPEKKSYNNYIDVPKLIKAYREAVNPDVMVYLGM